MLKKHPFYISTAIAYTSAIPHLGNVYEIILADAIARYKKMKGFDVYFQTGTDEHGQKIEANALANGLTPAAYASQISNEVERIYKAVDADFDKFIRTTDETHIKLVQKIFEKLYKQGDIYLGQYSGWYSQSDEAFILESELIDGKGPNGQEVVWTSEEAYFFKISKYQKQLLTHIKEYPNYIIPESRKNEMINNFLTNTVPDLCVSRTSFKWGIPVSFDKKHVIYVWIDALCNYITGLDYDPNRSIEEQSLQFKKFWPCDLHLIGKDILRFHTIYWPAILFALGLKQPKTILGHPWILFNKSKMSKSTANVVYVDDILKHFAVDSLRYFVLHEIPYAQDGNMTYDLLIERHNSDLCNTLGNLVNRSIGMANKYNQGNIKKPTSMNAIFEINLPTIAAECSLQYEKAMDIYKVGDAIGYILDLARSANKFIDISMPWEVFKSGDSEKINYILFNLFATIKVINTLLLPIIPQTALKINEQCNYGQLQYGDTPFVSLHDFSVGQASVLFERYDIEKKLKEIVEKP